MRSKRIIGILIIVILIMNLILFVPESMATSYHQVIINANSNNNNGIDAFPESYQILLKELVEKTGYTNWKFKPFYTDIDWEELTSSKNENRCLVNTVHKNSPSSWFCSSISKHLENGACSDGYYCASAKIVNYFLDPRNFLTETTIFQFLNLGADDLETIENIREALKGSFMEGNANNGESYAQIIYDASKQSGESALSIITRIYQELGKGSPGNPPNMVSGKDSTYPNTYNFFNYGATDGTGAQQRGLAYADKAGWHDPRTALVEGAKLIAGNYVKVGQNTKYLFKFNVVANGKYSLYQHQYMTNLQDPTNQSKILYDQYVENDLLNKELIFIIPVYKNMPNYVKLPSTLSGDDLYYVSSNYSSVGVRQGAGTNYDLLEGNTQLRKDTLVQVVERSSKTSNGVTWSKVRLEDGREGWISDEYLTAVNTKKDVYSVPEQPSEKENDYAKGDVNGDGRISPADYVLIKNHITGSGTLTGKAKEAADVNKDGKISPADYVLVKNHITTGAEL